METQSNSSELKKMWNESNGIQLALFFGAAILIVSVGTALGIIFAQKATN